MGLQFCRAPNAVAHQIYSKTDRQLVTHDAVWYGRNEVLLCRKHPLYRAYSSLGTVAARPGWKGYLRTLVLRLPASVEPILRFPCWVSGKLLRAAKMQGVGVQLLSRRRSIEFMRSAVRQTGSWQAFHQMFGMQLPIFCYHHVGPPQQGTYPFVTIGPHQFERDVQWLARMGYVGIRPADWLQWLRTGTGLPEKPVLLTFDDAYADLTQHALPVLQRYGFGGVVFVVTAQIGGTNRWDETRGSGTHRLMNEEQIRYWAKQGIDFGAHSRTHTDLTTLANNELCGEISGSQSDLENIVERPVISFAYPYGVYNETVRAKVQTTFDLAFSTIAGLNTLHTDPHLQRRIVVKPNDSLFDLACRLRWGSNPVRHVRAQLHLRSRLKAWVSG